MVVLEYHRLDPFENPDALDRIDYYGIMGYPTAKFNGKMEIAGGWAGVYGYYEVAFYEEIQNPSPCSLNILFDYDPTTRILKIKSAITAVDSFENAYLYYALAENYIYHPWQDLDSLHHVVRKMLPDHKGVVLPAMDFNDTYVDSQICTLDTAWNPRNCYVVVFVQRNYSGGWVLRSFKSAPLAWVFGDANGDEKTDVADIVFLVNYVFKKGPAPYPLGSGDPNNDCMVDVFDIIYMLNFYFRGGAAPLKGCAQ